MWGSLSKALWGWGAKPDATKEYALFEDFDAERERLRNFDLEAPVKADPPRKTQPGQPARRNQGGQS